jgi:hypothetical protein
MSARWTPALQRQPANIQGQFVRVLQGSFRLICHAAGTGLMMGLVL